MRSKHPVIVTTSKLMTTGVDCKLCKLIVLDNCIASMTEFKQIIGRGTRLAPDYGKEYFTIMDFRGVCRLFADPGFDGEPEPVEPGTGSSGDGERKTPPDNTNDRIVYRVNDVEVEIINERVQYLDTNGKLIMESLTDYSKKNILKEYSSLENFIKEWNESDRKQAIIEELGEHGVLLKALRETVGLTDIDDFDLICHIAFDKKPLSKRERAENVRKRDYLNKYEGLARDVLSALLDKYADDGIANLESISILNIDPFRKMGSPTKIAKAFGSKENLLKAIQELENEIYKAAA
jgi:type I restriction enzyme R subunit